MDIAALFNQKQTTAGYPNTDYPLQNFQGPQSLQPKGGTAETAHSVTPAQRKNIIIVIGVFAVAIYILWHLNYELGAGGSASASISG